MPGYTRNTALFEKVYTDTYGKVFYFLHRLTAKNDALTDDLVQNVYVALWEKMDTLNEEENYLPLLYTIAKRQLIDHCRKELSEQSKLDGWGKLQPAEGANTTTDQLTFKEISTGIEKVLLTMPERRREIFLLCREEGLSHREIASRMNISVHSVEQQMNLALKALQKEFRHFRYNEAALLAMMVIVSWEISNLAN
ncbi:sigma-70 family RNA polymerase sigma factor [uncultured Chitinophaga sp.]|uniref:sigma-70 family RNA polymerase sigma factor n=1 Tax=uncultured Chitinophaga sp. TaxID=339340 RepID=UPI0025E47A7F|nr:sigma-70 family RNA polymerase sigma factor [uncultured Chitinophaga sp.]